MWITRFVVGYGEEKYCGVNNDGAATQGTYSLLTPLASTPDELLAVILFGSSVPGLMDYVQIISCLTTEYCGF